MPLASAGGPSLERGLATIVGERVKRQVAHTKVSHSRAFVVRAYLLQTHEMLFDTHWHAFRVFGAVPIATPERQRTLRGVAAAALRAAEQRLVHLVQARLGPDHFTYIAVACPKPGPAGAALSMRLLEAA